MDASIAVTRHEKALELHFERRALSAANDDTSYEFRVKDLKTGETARVSVLVFGLDEERLRVQGAQVPELCVNAIRDAIDAETIEFSPRTEAEPVKIRFEERTPETPSSTVLRNFLCAHVYWLGYATSPDPGRLFVPLDRTVDLSYLGVKKEDIVREAWVLEQQGLITRPEGVATVAQPTPKLITDAQLQSQPKGEVSASSMTAHAANKQITMRQAHGEIHVFSVGIDAYREGSHFHALKVCSTDAKAVVEAFQDVRQLHAKAEGIKTLSSKTSEHPSRGNIIAGLKALAQGAEKEDRILFYFSGHGHRLANCDEFFLVPQDADSPDDPDTLLAFSRVREILNASDARQKIVILDACLSGPDTTHLKSPLAKVSEKYLRDYLSKSSGVAVLASSSADQSSTTQSPGKNLSLFTHFFVEALRGRPEALNDGFLTLDSLYSYVSVEVRRAAKSYQMIQQPIKYSSVEGEIVFANFNEALLAAPFELEAAPVVGVHFSDRGKARATDVLTRLARFSYHQQEYIQKMVNSQLPEYFQDRLGGAAADLCRECKFLATDVSISGAGLTFPGGEYKITYEAVDKRSGFFVHEVSFWEKWIEQPSGIPLVLRTLSLYPENVTLDLNRPIQPLSLLPGLQARGWRILSQRSDEVKAEHQDYTLTISPGSLTFEGFTPQQLLGTAEKSPETELVGGVLALVSPR